MAYRKTDLNELKRRSPEAWRAVICEVLAKEGGCLLRAHKSLDISRRMLYYAIDAAELWEVVYEERRRENERRERIKLHGRRKHKSRWESQRLPKRETEPDPEWLVRTRKVLKNG